MTDHQAEIDKLKQELDMALSGQTIAMRQTWEAEYRVVALQKDIELVRNERDAANGNARRWEEAYYDALKLAPQVGDGPTDEAMLKERTRVMKRELRRTHRFAEDAHNAMLAAFRMTGNPMGNRRKWWRFWA